MVIPWQPRCVPELGGLGYKLTPPLICCSACYYPLYLSALMTSERHTYCSSVRIFWSFITPPVRLAVTWKKTALVSCNLTAAFSNSDLETCLKVDNEDCDQLVESRDLDTAGCYRRLTLGGYRGWPQAKNSRHSRQSHQIQLTCSLQAWLKLWEQVYNSHRVE